MKFLDLTGLQHFYDKYLRPLKDAAFKNTANNLTTETEGSVLDARQGKVLNDLKLSIAKVINNLLTTEEGFALDARQGKVLDDKITELNGNIETGEDSNGNRYVRFKNKGLQICYGTFQATVALSANGSGFTGVSSSIQNGVFPKPFSDLRSLVIQKNDGDWAIILGKSANLTEITQVVLGYWGGYTSRSFAFDYVAIGTYTV